MGSAERGIWHVLPDDRLIECGHWEIVAFKEPLDQDETWLYQNCGGRWNDVSYVNLEPDFDDFIPNYRLEGYFESPEPVPVETHNQRFIKYADWLARSVLGIVWHEESIEMFLSAATKQRFDTELDWDLNARNGHLPDDDCDPDFVR